MRVGIAAARGIALAAGKPVIGVTTLAAYAAPFIVADKTRPVVAAVDARHDHVYLKIVGPGGHLLVAPRLASLREAVQRAAASGAPRLAGNAAALLAAAWPADETPPAAVERHAAPDIAWVARLGAAAEDTGAAGQAALSAPARRPAAGRRATAAPMMKLIARLFARGEAALSPATRAMPRPLLRCTPPRSGAAGVSRRSKPCCSTAT